MLLEGVVTNVAAFGAFIDIGVHQDGLVHVSAMAKRFITDPRDVVKPGDIVRVRVVNVDLARKRISLTLRLDDVDDRTEQRKPSGAGRRERDRKEGDAEGTASREAPPRPTGARCPDTAVADALRRAGLRT
jgi:uncharacterized protein